MSENSGYSVSFGGAGAVVAVILSASLNHSVGWAILHFFCSWFYVLYVIAFRTKQIVPALKNMFM